jgi:hypothetical protein
MGSGNGNIIFQGINNNLSFLLNGARNGLSYDVNTNYFVLGNNVGDPLNPSQLSSNREIKYSAFRLIFQGFAANNQVYIGALDFGFQGIKITGTNALNGNLWMRNADAATYKDWRIESNTADTGQLMFNDSVGNFFFLNRNTSSLAAPLHCFQKVRDTAVNLVLSLTGAGIVRPRHVITNRGAAGNIIITLPTVVALPQFPEYTFTDIVGTTITIQAPAGVTIRIGAVISPAGGTVTGAAFSTVRLQAISTTEWVAISVVGVWVTP